MSKLKVSIINPTTLRLDERGEIGDIIDLLELQSVDNSSILEAIQKAKDKEYETLLAKAIEQQESYKKIALNDLERKFQDQMKKMQIENERLNTVVGGFDARLTLERSAEELKVKTELNSEKADLERRIAELNAQLASQQRLTEMEVSQLKNIEIQIKQDEIRNLQHQISSLKEQQSLLLDKTRSTIETQMNVKINENNEEIGRLNREIAALKNEEAIELQKRETEILLLNSQLKGKDEVLQLEIDKALAVVKQDFTEQINQREIEISRLRSEKSRLQIKLLGEELEKECDEMYQNHALSGFMNCTWEKHNIAIKDGPDEKATKADYIFRVYLDAQHRKEDLLTSVCCEIKNESTESKNKTKNADHFKKLHEDRNKSECEYALLISELEWDTVNDAPIKKITEFKDMYLVRPAYFISFLSLIQSLANKYKDLLNERRRDELTFQESKAILDEFEGFKATYLDKPLTSLQKDVEEIKKEANKAYESSYKILGLADTIITNKIAEIRVKIDRLDIRKTARRVAQLTSED